MNESSQGAVFPVSDDFEREKVVDKLIALLVSDKSLFPIMLDGGWGTGKTTFCKRLLHRLDGSGASELSYVYFDAFRPDHANEPLISLFSAILSKLGVDADTEGLINKSLPILRFLTKTSVNALAVWALKESIEDLDGNLQEELENSGKGVINRALGGLLKEQQQIDKRIEDFQCYLKRVVEKKNLIVIVDELDRCKPDYAVSLLEIIKHIFDVEGVKFLLVANMEQLSKAIEHSYGASMDGKAYLEKFYKFRICLPDSAQRDIVHAWPSYLVHYRNLILNSSLSEKLGTNRLDVNCRKFVEELISVRPLSLREVEKFVLHLEVFDTLTRGGRISNSDPLLFINIYGIYLHCFHPEMAAYLERGVVLVDELASTLGRSSIYVGDERNYDNLADALVAMFLIHSGSIRSAGGIKFTDVEHKNWWLNKINQITCETIR